MKRWIWVCAAMLALAGVASAQDNPKMEAFGGYSYVRVNPGFGAPGLNFNGGSGSASFNATPWLGVVADFGGYHWSQSGVDATVVTYLFGPKVGFHRGPITPFVQTLFGGGHISGGISGLCPVAVVRAEGAAGTGGGGAGSGSGGSCTVSGSENAFSMAVGGGVDWNVTAHIGVRVVQAEYLMTRFSSTTQNNARISAGFVVRF